MLGNVEEEEEEDSAGGPSVSSKPILAGPVSSPVYGRESGASPDGKSSMSSNSGGVAAAPPDELGAMPQVALSALLTPTKSGAASNAASPQHGATAVQSATDARAAETNGRIVQQLRMHQESQHQRHAQHVAFQAAQQNQPQHQHQWDDVVRCMAGPQRGTNGTRSNGSSTHSLDVSSVDLSSPRSSGLKNEYETLLLTSQQGSGGPWGSSDGGSGLLSPMPPPQSGPSLRGGWSFDTTPIGDGEFSSGNVMDLADVDNLFRSGDGEGGGTAVPARSVSGISGTSADAGAGSRHETGSARWMSQGLAMEKVGVEPSRKVKVLLVL